MTIASRWQEGKTIDHTPSSDVTAGTPVLLDDGLVGIPENDLEDGVKGAVDVEGVFKVAANSSDTWSDGDPLMYDASAEKVVARSLTADGSADFYLGTALGDKDSGDTTAYVILNARQRGVARIDPIVYEFDCDADDTVSGDTDDHVLIPAEQNPNGLWIVGIYGLVTERFAGDSEDQGVVTVSDESGNVLGTLTPTDGGADVVGDVIVGYSAPAASTGDAGVTVAAGEFVDAKVTQQCDGGTPAGKMKVLLDARPLL